MHVTRYIFKRLAQPVKTCCFSAKRYKFKSNAFFFFLLKGFLYYMNSNPMLRLENGDLAISHMPLVLSNVDLEPNEFDSHYFR